MPCCAVQNYALGTIVFGYAFLGLYALNLFDVCSCLAAANANASAAPSAEARAQAQADCNQYLFPLFWAAFHVAFFAFDIAGAVWTFSAMNCVCMAAAAVMRGDVGWHGMC